jgi:hypothetical protein
MARYPGAGSGVLSLSVLALLAGACGRGANPDDFAVRDSAGVRIVENGAAPEPGGSWQLSAEPEVDIGVLEGAPEYQLYRVSDAVRLGDGRIVVADNGAHQLRFYDPAGRYMMGVGREGDGPGEFRTLSRLLPAAGDTLVVFDARLRRASWFSPSGEFIRSVEVGHASNLLARVGGMFADGTLLGMAERLYGGDIPQGVMHNSTVYYRFASDGSVMDTLGVLPSREMFGRAEGRAFYMTSLPFGMWPSSTSAGRRFYSGTGERPEVAVRDVDGRLAELVRWRQAARAVTDADVAAEKARRLENVQDEKWRRRVNQMFADMPLPETMPFFTSLLVDAIGDLWVGGFAPPGQARRAWLVFDPDGRLLATVSMPSGLRVTQIGDASVLGIWSDDMDVEHVRSFSLRRSESPAG